MITKILIGAVLAVVCYIWGKVPVSMLLDNVFRKWPEKRREAKYRAERLAREKAWDDSHCPECNGREFQECRNCGKREHTCRCSFDERDYVTKVGCEECNWTGLPPEAVNSLSEARSPAAEQPDLQS